MTSTRTILVTGCSSGIGAHCAEALGRDGWQVFATARKPEDIAALEQAGFRARYLDYSDPASIASLADDVLAETGGRLDALFNNGAYAQPGAVEDVPVEALRAQFEAGFFGWHDLTRRIVPAMRQQGSGRIVHTSSILGLVPMKWRGAYVAAKFALEGLMLTLRMELEGSGIHVSLIEPGPIESRLGANALPSIREYIDIDGSVHREHYRRQLASLEAGRKSPGTLGPEAVYGALRDALESARPRAHYVVTRPAKLGALGKRLLPAALLYRLLASQS
jgi:NAD(P)-dependent dehydrogenase (short-subunit alcohol dehydrogenase family)